MALFLLTHTHAPDACAVSFAAWRGSDSPLRSSEAVSACVHGDHTVWWLAEADDAATALALLPAYVARSTEVVEVRRVLIP